MILCCPASLFLSGTPSLCQKGSSRVCSRVCLCINIYNVILFLISESLHLCLRELAVYMLPLSSNNPQRYDLLFTSQYFKVCANTHSHTHYSMTSSYGDALNSNLVSRPPCQFYIFLFLFDTLMFAKSVPSLVVWDFETACHVSLNILASLGSSIMEHHLRPQSRCGKWQYRINATRRRCGSA